MRIAAAVLFLCALATPVVAQQERRPLSQVDARTRALVDKVVAGLGGADRLDRLRTFAMTAKVSGPPDEEGSPQSGTLTLIVAFPDRVYTKLDIGKTPMTIVATPDHSFITTPAFPVGAGMKLKPAEREQFLGLLFNEPIYVLWKRRHASVTFAHGGQRKLNGREVEMLEIGTTEGVGTWAVDAETGRLVAHIEDGAVTEMSNWKNVKGVYIAARQVSRKVGVKEPSIAIITAADADMPLDNSLFKPPSTWIMRGD